MIRRPPRSTLFPYTRSSDLIEGGGTPGLLAIEQNATGKAKELALSYARGIGCTRAGVIETDRKSTRLNSSHGYISYSGFCLEKIRSMVRDHYAVLSRPTSMI